MDDEDYLGPIDGEPIMVCPACGAKAWVGCPICGWDQWTPPDDPDRLRDGASADDYAQLIDWLHGREARP